MRVTSPLTRWRRDVTAALAAAYPSIDGKRVNAYSWPVLAPDAPCFSIYPGGGSSVLVDYTNETLCGAGEPQARITFMLDHNWEEAAFDELEQIASTIKEVGYTSGLFDVLRIGAPGVVDDIPNAAFIAIPVDIAGDPV